MCLLLLFLESQNKEMDFDIISDPQDGHIPFINNSADSDQHAEGCINPFEINIPGMTN